jgi:hypothetical protein
VVLGQEDAILSDGAVVVARSIPVQSDHARIRVETSDDLDFLRLILESLKSHLFETLLKLLVLDVVLLELLLDPEFFHSPFLKLVF